jgi:hypothetical protein
VKSWVVGARACSPSGECSQRSVGRAVDGGGERVLCRAVGPRECTVFFSGRNPKNARLRLRASKEVGTDRWNGVN